MKFDEKYKIFESFIDQRIHSPRKVHFSDAFKKYFHWNILRINLPIILHQKDFTKLYYF